MLWRCYAENRLDSALCVCVCVCWLDGHARCARFDKRICRKTVAGSHDKVNTGACEASAKTIAILRYFCVQRQTERESTTITITRNLYVCRTNFSGTIFYTNLNCVCPYNQTAARKPEKPARTRVVVDAAAAAETTGLGRVVIENFTLRPGARTRGSQSPYRPPMRIIQEDKKNTHPSTSPPSSRAGP